MAMPPPPPPRVALLPRLFGVSYFIPRLYVTVLGPTSHNPLYKYLGWFNPSLHPPRRETVITEHVPQSLNVPATDNERAKRPYHLRRKNALEMAKLLKTTRDGLILSFVTAFSGLIFVSDVLIG